LDRNGRPLEGTVVQIRRSIRANYYHNAIRSVINEEADIVKTVKTKLAQFLLSNNHRPYWAEIRKFKRRNKNIRTVIDDAPNQADIVDAFC
jgi:hypothetical protein